MMSEPFVYTLRFLLYVDLMLLFGVPLFARSQRLAPLLGWRSWGLLLAVGGLAMVLLDATLRVSTLLDVAPDALGVDDLAWFIGATTAGRAALVRGAVLALLLLLLLPRRQHARQLLPQTALAAIALASLAWNGHAGAGDYLQGWPRLSAGIIHLLAAGAWLGAIMALLGLLRRSLQQPSGERAAALLAGLRGFALPGTIIVALLAITGSISYIDLGGSIASLTGTTHGRWLSFKLLLVAGMLLLAALHRWRLVPALAVALQTRAAHPLRALRRSLALEALLALLVLACVAVLGTLDPTT